MVEHFTYHSKLLKRMKCKLTTITPCHIGSGNTLNRNVDFVSDGEFLGVIDPRKIFDIVGESGIAGWCSVIDSQGDIMQYLRGVCPDVKIQDISSRLLEIQVGNSKVTGLREQISTLGTPYIPGSSIKGAIVSAILAANADRINIPSNIKQQNGVVDKVFSAREEGRNGREQFDPKTSVLRFLRVGDALFDDVPTIAVYCNSLNIRESKANLKVEKGHQYVEAIYTDTAAEFDIDIKTEYLKRVHSHQTPLGAVPAAMGSISDLLQCINTHTISLLKRELEAWEDYDYPELDDYLQQIEELIDECKACRDGRSAIMRLGYGSGWDFITGGWSKLSATDAEWDRIVDKARPNNKSYQEYMFPKTRRTFDSYLPLGFVRIDIAE